MPLKTSNRPENSPHFFPRARKTFVPPVRPLPSVVISIPFVLADQVAKGDAANQVSNDYREQIVEPGHEVFTSVCVE